MSCECDATGTQTGLNGEVLVCNQNSGQCSCLTDRLGRTCDICAEGMVYLLGLMVKSEGISVSYMKNTLGTNMIGSESVRMVLKVCKWVNVIEYYSISEK